MQRILILLLILPLHIFAQKDAKLAQDIKVEFFRSYKAYKSFAFENDALSPVSKSGYNEFYKSFYLTALENYSTLTLMEYDQEASEVKEYLLTNLKFNQYIHVPTTSFGKRAISALIAAYQLDGDKRFIEQATDIANRLLPAFNTPTGMPNRLIHLGKRTTKENLCTPNEVGGLVLEFGLLSKITNNPVYYKKAKQAAVKLWELRSTNDLLGSKVDVITGKWANRSVNAAIANTGYWQALLKTYLLLGDNHLMNIYQQGMKALKKHTLETDTNQAFFRYSRINDLNHNDSLFQYSEFAMTSLLALEGESELANKHHNYCKAQVDSFILSPRLKDLRKGRWTSLSHALYSEQFESLFYLHHYAKSTAIPSDAKMYYGKLKEICKTEDAYSGIKNMITGSKDNRMPSSFLAENLKYLYLIFGEHKWKIDRIVFSDSGQPLMAIN